MDEKTMNTEHTENLEQEVEETTAEPQQEAQAEAAPQVDEKLAQAEEKYLRLAAEYDNYRKRTAKEKDALYQDAKADTIREFLERFLSNGLAGLFSQLFY